MTAKTVMRPTHIVRDNRFFTALIYLICIAFGVLCITPFLLMLGGSFMLEADIRKYGYQIIPTTFSTYAYEILFMFPGRIASGYRVTTIVTVVGTIGHLIVCSLAGYPLAAKSVKYRRIFQVYIIITMVLNGGMVSWYYIMTKMLHLRNNIWTMILPMLVSPFNIYLIRNYYAGIPDEMAESATIDGAGQLRIFAQIILPLSKPVIATVALFISINYWNEWFNSMMLNDLPEYFSLQLILRSIVSQVQFLKSNTYASGMIELFDNLPGEGVKTATAMITVGPIIIVYPFIQKYFVKGIMVGAVKG